MDKLVLAIAIQCHMANKAYCESLGDLSQTGWLNAPEWQQESAIKGVEFHISNPSAKPSATHESWLAEKKKNGWVYGEEKNEVKKTHPCMVPFDKLPKEQQAKDVIFKAIVDANRFRVPKKAEPIDPTKKPAGSGVDKK